jgi:myo-inositol 2-dehydrogenase/D-chiro-inositol 1-dehydrogenase
VLDGVAPSPDGADGLQALVLAEAAARSLAEGRTVAVSEI